MRVLLLADVETDGTTALITALTNAGYNVTTFSPEFQWDENGIQNPSLGDFDVVVHLDGKTYNDPLSVVAQGALQDFVQNGGGFVASQWDGYELTVGQQTAMPQIVLQRWADGATNDCMECTMTWTVVDGQADHPVLKDIPPTFDFWADAHDAGGQVVFDTQPSTVLMTAPLGGPAVLVRDFGTGRVVEFAAAPNFSTVQTLQDPNIQKLYVNAVAWAAHNPVKLVAFIDPVQPTEATGPVTSVELKGSATPATDGLTYAWCENVSPCSNTDPASIASGADVTVGFTVGSHTVVLTVADANGNSGSATTTVTITDTTAPTVTITGPLTYEATSASGATATFAVTATDLVDGSISATSIHCEPFAIGGTFPLGATVESCSATDAHGNVGMTTVTVTVVDTTPPTLLLPTGPVLEATSAAGAVAVYAASAVDIVDGAVAPACVPVSGSTFPLGSTTVVCTATDAHGNVSSGSFAVTVRDTTPPSITAVPPDQVVEATSAAGAAATFPLPAATDIVDGAVIPVCSPPPGATFPLGSTTVICTATDAHGNSSSASFVVMVHDTTAPALADVPASLVLEATGPGGAVGSFPTPTATDLVDGTVPVSCNPASGSTFPLGTTYVTCSAADAVGNRAESTFPVTVVDTTPPALSLPASVVAEATGPGGAVVTFAAAAVDLVDGPVPVTCTSAGASPVASGDTFPVGTTPVTCTAADTRGNVASGSFSVEVRDTTPPSLILPGDISVNATGPDGAAVEYTATAYDIVDGAVTVSCTPPSGSVFPPGVSAVTCTAMDGHGNATSGTFQVTVTVSDPNAPVVTVPGNIVAFAASAAGTVIEFAASAVDDVDGPVPVSCLPTSGSLFPVGATTVTCSAQDSSGNVGTASFTISVVFSWDGLLPPIRSDGRSIFRRGRTVPVKFHLSDASTGITNVVARLYVAKVTDDVLGDEDEADSTSAADVGNLFRYSAGSDQYIFNLSTSALSTGTWALIVDMGDGVIRATQISLR